MRKKSLSINAALNICKTVLSYIFPLITIPYITRVLQVEAVGVFNFSNSIVSYFVLLAGLGVGTYAIREGTQYRESRVDITRFVSEVFSINIYSTIISYILLFISLSIVPKLSNYSTAILILSIEIVFTTIGVNWVCNIYEDFLFIAIQSIGVQAVSLFLTLLLVKSPSDIYKYIAIVAFSKSASSVINFFYIRHKYCKFRFMSKCNVKRHIKPIMIMFSTAIAVTIYVSSDTTMIGFMLSDYQVGLYSTAVKIYQIVKNILAAILIVFVPRFALLLQSDNRIEADKLFSRVFNILVVMIFPATVGLIVTSKDVIRLVGGDNYLAGADSLRLLCVAISFSLIATLYTSCILIPKRKETVVFKATVISALANILLNFIFIPMWGINGAAVTTIIAEALVCIISALGSKDDVHLYKVGYNIFTVGLGCIGICIVGYICSKLFSEYLARLFITMITAAITYGTILVLAQNPVMKESLQKAKKH